MWSMWNAPSDLDYYDQSGFGGDEPEQEEELDPEEELEFPDEGEGEQQ